MQLLYSAAKYTRQRNDLTSIYKTFIGPVLEQSAPVWSSSLTIENCKDLERVQKAATRLIMGIKYKSYQSALTDLGMKTLKERRIDLSLIFAKRTLQNKKVRSMFPKRKELRSNRRRKTEFYKVNKANTVRLKTSAIPTMQNLLNKAYQDKKEKNSY